MDVYFYSMNDGSDLLELSKEYTTREFLQMEVKIIQREYEEIIVAKENSRERKVNSNEQQIPVKKPNTIEEK